MKLFSSHLPAAYCVIPTGCSYNYAGYNMASKVNGAAVLSIATTTVEIVDVTG